MRGMRRPKICPGRKITVGSPAADASATSFSASRLARVYEPRSSARPSNGVLSSTVENGAPLVVVVGT